MNAEEPALAEVAATVADGQPVDWGAVRGRVPERQRRLIRHLQLVENISHLHRTIAAEALPDVEPGADPVRRWGPFLLLERIGEGVTGEVYRAWDSQLHRDVALKLLRHDPQDRATARERVLEEARRLARIRHEHVVQVYGAESHDGRVGLWMELLRGESLEQIVRTRGPLPVDEAARYGRHLCAALSAVHAAGLLHRDVKAQNVIVEKSGRTVLMDLGTGEELRRSAGSNRLIGTPLYLAPEIFKGERATFQSDVYSLGVLLFHLVTSEFPLTASSMPELARAHTQGRARCVADVRPDLPRPFARAVDRAIASNPAERFRTVGELDSALAVVDRPRLAASRRRWSFAGVASVLAAAVLALIVWSGGFSPGTRDNVTTVAVAPIRPIDPAATPDHLAQGLTEQLIATLGQIRSLRVRPTSSPGARSLGGATTPDALLETSLQVSAPRDGSAPLLRLHARLLAAGTGDVLWARTFEEPLGEMFRLQAAMARRIATALNAEITRPEQARLAQSRQTSAEAEQAFLEGRAFMEGYGVEYTRRALDSFRRATNADPGHAGAHAGAARALFTLGFSNIMSQPVARAQAEAQALQALELDDTLPDAHATLADIAFYYDWDWDRAEAGYVRSLQLNPSQAYARSQYADLLAASRRTGEALEQSAMLLDLLPVSADVHREHGLFLYYDRQFDAAERAVHKSLEFERNAPGAWVILGRIAEAQGRLNEARQHTDHGVSLTRGAGLPALLAVQQIRLQALAGDRAGAVAALARLRRESDERGMLWNPQFEAYVHLALGDHAQALDFLEAAAQQRQPSLLWLAVDPRMDPLRDDPRFRDIVHHLGLQ